jgi:mitogen-activated protein kinase 1/3
MSHEAQSLSESPRNHRHVSFHQEKDEKSPCDSTEASSGESSNYEAAGALPPRYQKSEFIGKGAYGCVFEAYDHLRSRQVAIKKQENIFEDLPECCSTTKRILREIAILSELEDEHVVHLYDVIAPGGADGFQTLYMVMELCDSDLRQLLKKQFHLTTIHIKKLVSHLLSAVEYLHAVGVWHRDLKCANCLVNRECTLKICDFGLARAVGECRSRAARLRLESVVDPDAEGATTSRKRHLTNHVVTRWYRAPEVILLQPYTEKIDIWAVGCIYVEMLGMLDGARFEDRRPLFCGECCYPLSPAPGHDEDQKYHIRKRHDQLNKIFDIIGTPSEADIENIGKDAQPYLRKFKRRPGVGVSSVVPSNAELGSGDLLTHMLQFDSESRASASELLGHGYFSGHARTAREHLSQRSVALDWDTVEGNDDETMPEDLLRSIFGRELQKYSGNA